MSSSCPKCGGTNIRKEVVRDLTRKICRRCGPLPKKGKNTSR